MNIIMQLILASPWLAPFVGLVAIATMIWFVGPQIAFGTTVPLASESARLIAILVVILLFALKALFNVLKKNKANKGMVEGIVDAKAAAEPAGPGRAPGRSQEEVNTLKERFEQATTVLKKSKGKKGKLSLYDLPWYIIIGPPGSGKTTALVNSGLDFPLADQFGKEALGGVGGTRNCDWWFTDEAILLDTAGRYTTQDSDASVDKSAWEGFLALLKKYRKRRPINGVIVAISLLDLMTLNQHERISHARAIKTRIQELDKFFGIRFPVYVMLTKGDLVAGFMEFFDDLSRNEREQVWGSTFPIELSDSELGAADRFAPEFDGLLDRLSSRLLWRMSQERDPRRRAAIYGFPRQLASLRDNLAAFLADVFRGSRFEQAPMLRGVYITSGTQEGTPIDRLMGMVARTFGLDQQVLPAQGGRGRSYFLKGMLKDVMFRESEVAGTNRRFESQRAWVQRAAYIGSLVFALLLAAAWTVSYLNNRAMIEQARAATTAAQEAFAAVPADDTDVLSLVPALESVRAIPAIYEGEGAPWLQGLGLYQGRKLAGRSEVAYERALRELLLPRLIARTEGHLRTGGASADFLYEALKAYLTLDSREHYERNTLELWFDYDYLQYLQPRGGQAEHDAYMGHVNTLFERQPVPLPVALDAGLIDQTQRVVARMPTEQRAYLRLKQSEAAQSLKPFTLFDAAGPRSQLVFQSRGGAGPGGGVPGFFTREGYQRFFVAKSAQEASVLIDESWILGPYLPPGLDAATLLTRVKGLYLEEFVTQYENFLADIRLAPFASVEEASNILSILSDPANSPLVLLLRAVAEQTQLDPPAVAAAAEAAAGGARSLADRLGGGQAPRVEGLPNSATSIVDARFKALREFVGAGGDPTKAPVQLTVALFDQLYRFMAVVASQGGAAVVSAKVNADGQAAVQQAREAARRDQPPLVQALLQDAATNTQTLASRGVQANINAQWQAEGLPFCREAISGRYPIVRGTTQEIRLDDFGRFFGHTGIVDTFFRQYLTDYVDMTRKPWRARTSAASPVQIKDDALRQFERAAAIRDTFFRTGGAAPSVTFNLKPVGMDQSITNFTLDMAGQRLTYDHGPVRPTSMKWPGPKESGEVRMEMAPPAAGSMYNDQGPWAWFRLLDKADIQEAERAETFTVEFKLGQRAAVYELVASSAYNPFNFAELLQFNCPESL